MQAWKGKLAGNHPAVLPAATLFALVDPPQYSDYKFTVEITEDDLNAGKGVAKLGPMPIGTFPDFHQYLFVQQVQPQAPGDVEWGFAGADGNLDAGYPNAEKVSQQGQQAKLYHADQTGPQRDHRADLKHAGNFVAHFKKAGRYTFSVGRG